MKSMLLGSIALGVASASAFAADLPSRSAPAPVFAQKAFSWTGVYVGVNAGAVGLSNNSDYNASNSGMSTGSAGYADDGYFANGFGGGAMVGGTIGYNHQFGGIVVGLEADFAVGRAGASASDVNVDDYITHMTANLSSFGTLRGRVGVAFDRTLVYVTGGLAFGSFKGTLWNDNSYQDYIVKTSSTRTGWVVGAGVEYALTNNVSLKVEGLYADFGSKSSAATDCVECRGQFKTKATVGRVGVNYKF